MPLLPEIKTDKTPSIDGLKDFDLESLLSVARIREHTKTDDVPHVTDDMLRLYRDAAFEAAELYTGLLFKGHKRMVEEAAHTPTRRQKMHGFYTHRTRYLVSDGIVYLYGARDGSGTQEIRTTPNARNVRIPIIYDVFDPYACCGDPCKTGNFGMRLMYRAGYACAEDIPAGILLGCLKFIAWSVQNPGDEIMTVRNRLAGDSAGIIGTNNGAWASGAIEQWRMYVSEP